jgi:uncharacterized RDD family membrane protein YckC
MNQPPGPPDPNELTQPIPIVQPPPPPRPNAPSQTQSQYRSQPMPRPGYAHRFGNVPLYLFARVAALAIDLFALAFVLTSFGFSAFDRGLQTFAGRDQAGFITLGGGSVAIGLLLAYLCEALTGSTLGKMTFALHTRRADGGHAGGGRVLLRYVLLPLDLLLIGPFLALVTRRHQRLGDILAGTVVSGSRIGFFAPLIGIAILAGLGYAQVAYGGGVSSAIEVAAVTSNVVPGFVTKAARLVGLGSLRFPAISIPGLPVASPTPFSPLQQPEASSSPLPLESPALTAPPTAPPTALATALVTEAPSAAATGVTSVERPGYPTDPPEGFATDDPDAQPTDRVVVQ